MPHSGVCVLPTTPDDFQRNKMTPKEELTREIRSSVTITPDTSRVFTTGLGTLSHVISPINSQNYSNKVCAAVISIFKMDLES